MLNKMKKSIRSKRLSNKLLGYSPFSSLYKAFKRIISITFILFGIGFFISQKYSISGAVISTKGINEAGIIISVCSLIIGGMLLFKELRKGKT